MVAADRVTEKNCAINLVSDKTACEAGRNWFLRTDVSLEVQFFTRDWFTMISFKISFRGLLYVQWPPSVKYSR
jgi:hypothetical protein